MKQQKQQKILNKIWLIIPLFLSLAACNTLRKHKSREQKESKETAAVLVKTESKAQTVITEKTDTLVYTGSDTAELDVPLAPSADSTAPETISTLDGDKLQLIVKVDHRHKKITARAIKKPEPVQVSIQRTTVVTTQQQQEIQEEKSSAITEVRASTQKEVKAIRWGWLLLLLFLLVLVFVLRYIKQRYL
jgi:DNA polymerase III gamma/tau subunit